MNNQLRVLSAAIALLLVGAIAAPAEAGPILTLDDQATAALDVIVGELPAAVRRKVQVLGRSLPVRRLTPRVEPGDGSRRSLRRRRYRVSYVR